MPSLTITAPAEPKPAAEQPKPDPKGGEVLYPEFAVKAKIGADAITYEVMKDILWWESEPEYTARMVALNPKIKEDAAKFSDKLLAQKGVEVLCLDEEGRKVVCWNNAHNRPFDLPWAMRYKQEFLNGCWAVNGEAFIIGDRGNVLSGQKRGVGFMLAVQAWRKDPEKYKEVWPTEPVYETVLAIGVKEDSRTVATLDNGQPRSDADTIFTSEIYAGLSPAGKKECSRMLAKATDFLWARTGEARGHEGQVVYKTPSEAARFREDHPKLMKAVKHLYEENKDRAISGLKLSPGMCAAICYMQGCSTSDGDSYRAGDPPVEKGLKWDNWTKAQEFWTELAKAGSEGKGQSKLHAAVATALGMLVDPDDGTQGRLSEKLVILAKAWELFAAGKKFNESDLEIGYVERDGKTILDPDQTLGFGGIDLGPGKPKAAEEPEVTEPEAKATREQIAKEAIQRVEETPAQEKARRDAVLKAAEAKKEEAKKALLANRQAREAAAKPNGKPAAKAPVKIKGVSRK